MDQTTPTRLDVEMEVVVVALVVAVKAVVVDVAAVAAVTAVPMRMELRPPLVLVSLTKSPLTASPSISVDAVASGVIMTLPTILLLLRGGMAETPLVADLVTILPITVGGTMGPLRLELLREISPPPYRLEELFVVL